MHSNYFDSEDEAAELIVDDRTPIVARPERSPSKAASTAHRHPLEDLFEDDAVPGGATRTDAVDVPMQALGSPPDMTGGTPPSTASAKKPSGRRRSLDLDPALPSHPHQPPPNTDAATRAVRIAFVLCLMFMFTELVAGSIANSLAILTDAAHMLTDAGSLALQLFALRSALLPPDARFTFGYRRAETLGALVSVCVIYSLVGFIWIEAITRIGEIIVCYNASTAASSVSGSATPAPTSALDGVCNGVDAPVMLVVGAIGIGVNLTMMFILSRSGQGHSHFGMFGQESCSHGHSHGCHGHGALNIRSAMLHSLSDCLQSFGVAVAAGVIWYANGTANHPNGLVNLIDPLVSFVFGAVTLWTARPITRELIDIVMQKAPAAVPTEALQNDLRSIQGVVSVRHLHVWVLAPGVYVMSATLVTSHATSAENDDILVAAHTLCRNEYRLRHCTLEVRSATVHRHAALAEEAAAEEGGDAALAPCSIRLGLL